MRMAPLGWSMADDRKGLLDEIEEVAKRRKKEAKKPKDKDLDLDKVWD